MLTEKIKQIADAVVDKHATVDSVAAQIGPWKGDGGSQCELTPRDPNFHDGYIEAEEQQNGPHLPLGKRRLDYVTLTLARDAVLTPDALEKAFGKWRAVPPPPEGNPYRVVFYYPHDKATLSVAVFAELSGPPQQDTTRVTSVLFRRDDIAGS